MQSKNNTNESVWFMRLVSVITVVIMVWYVFVCVCHYFSQRPLWLDESMVFESVQGFLPAQFFTQKLAAGQIFPKLYLFCVQRIAALFDLHLLAVRFLSFVAMLSAFAIWMKIVSYELKDRLAYMTYVLSWAGSSFLVYYSAELKPYSMDVFAAGLFVLFIYNADKLYRDNKVFYLWGCLLLPLLGLVSYTAVLFFFFLFYHLLRVKTKDVFWIQCFLAFGAAVVLSLGFIYYYDIRLAKADTATQGFIDHIVSLASIGDFFKTWWEGTMDLFCRFFADRPRIFKRIAVPFGLLGFGYMFYTFAKSFRSSGYRFVSLRTIALVLYAELFILGVLQKYPFSVARTSLFFAPIVMFLIVEAIVSLKGFNKKLSMIVHSLYIVFLIIIAYGIGREALSGHLGFSPLIW